MTWTISDKRVLLVLVWAWMGPGCNVIVTSVGRSEALCKKLLAWWQTYRLVGHRDLATIENIDNDHRCHPRRRRYLSKQRFPRVI